MKKDTAKQALATFVQSLVKRRKARGLSQEKLAEESGISLNAIKLIETGNRFPRLDTIVALAIGLQCEPSDLLRAPDAEDESNDLKHYFTIAAKLLMVYGMAPPNVQENVDRALPESLVDDVLAQFVRSQLSTARSRS